MHTSIYKTLEILNFFINIVLNADNLPTYIKYIIQGSLKNIYLFSFDHVSSYTVFVQCPIL